MNGRSFAYDTFLEFNKHFQTYLSSLCLYFMSTVPVTTSIIQIEFPPQVATLEVVLLGSLGSGSKTTSQIWKMSKIARYDILRI